MALKVVKSKLAITAECGLEMKCLKINQSKSLQCFQVQRPI